MAEPFLHLDLPPDVGSLTFDSLEDLIGWLEAEQGYWAWIVQEKNRSESFSQALAKFGGRYSRLIADAKKFVSEKPSSPKKEQLKNDLITFFENGKALHRASPRAAFLQAVRMAHGDQIAREVLALYINEESPEIDKTTLPRRLFDLSNLGLALDPLFIDSSAVRQAVERVEQATTEIEEQEESILSELTTWKKERDQDLLDWKAEHDANVKRAIEKLHEDIAEAKSFLLTDLEAKAPVEFWTDKCVYHKKVIARLTRSTIWFTLAFFSLVCLLAWWGKPIENFVTFFTQQSADPEELGRASVYVVFLFLGIWILRILVRVLLSHIHLLEEANEKVAITKAILAISRTNVETSTRPIEKEREILFGALVRPTTIGIVKDDTTPPIIWEYLSRLPTK